MTPRNSTDAHPDTPGNTVALNGFFRVVRTGRLKAAGTTNPGAEDESIAVNQQDTSPAHNPADRVGPQVL